LLSVSQYTGVTVRGKDNNSRESESLRGYKVCHPGDFVSNIMLAWMGAFGVTNYHGVVSPAYCVYRLTHDGNQRYFDYLFHTPRYLAEFARNSTGIIPSRWRLYTDDFFRIPCILPPREEQDAIVAYLDEKTAVINKFITHKQRLIDLLQEQKQVVVNTAVTQGLDPHVPRKPSGIEWLGDIPAHWQGVRLKQLSEFIQTGPFGSQLHVHDYVDNKTPVINPIHLQNGQIVPDLGITVNEDVVARLSRHQLQVGDVILARRGELGRCAVVDLESSGWLCGTGSMNLRPKPNMVYSPYLAQVFQTEKVKTWLSTESVGSTMDNLNLTILSTALHKYVPILKV
jgi:type I restriction enzyme, S subunit